MHRSRKPVRKCHGCGLNFGDHCGVFASPHDQWHDREHCPGHMNEVLLAEHLERARRTPLKKKKERRQTQARESRGEPHHNGDRHVAIKTY